MRLFLMAVILGNLVLPVSAVEDHDWKRQAQGTWRLIAVVDDGKDVAIPLPTLMTVTENRFTVTVNGKPFSKGSATADGNTSPLQATVTTTEGPETGKVTRQISMIHGDVLIACAKVGSEPPKQFESKPGSANTLSIWLRVK